MKYALKCKGQTGYLRTDWYDGDCLDDVFFVENEFDTFEEMPSEETLREICDHWNKYRTSGTWIHPKLFSLVAFTIITKGELEDLLKDLPEGSMGRKIVEGLLAE